MTYSSSTLQISFGVGIPSRDFTSDDLFSSRMISMHSSTHSSQMNTVGPAINLRTSCWLLPQNEQYSVFLESLVPTLLILVSVRPSISSARSLHSGTYRPQVVDSANSVPEKTLYSTSRQNGGQLESPTIVALPDLANHGGTRLSRIR